MTRLTQMILATRDDVVVTAVESTNGMFALWITYGANYQPLLTSEFSFGCAGHAIDHGEALVAEAKKAWCA